MPAATAADIDSKTETGERRLGQPDDIQIIPKGTRLEYHRTSYVTIEDTAMRGSMSIERHDDMLKQYRSGKRPIV